MKRTLKFMLCAVTFMLILCACSKSEPLSLILMFPCDGNTTWQYEMTKQGVVDIVGEPQKDVGTDYIMFIFEAVGEGETELDFYCVESEDPDISKANRSKKYNISVNADFEITSELISDEEITVPAVKLSDKKEAEAYLEQKLGMLVDGDTDDYVIKYKETYVEDGVTWYKFSVSMIITKRDGKTILRFKQIYAVSEFGEIKTLDEGEGTPDVELSNK